MLGNILHQRTKHLLPEAAQGALPHDQDAPARLRQGGNIFSSLATFTASFSLQKSCRVTGTDARGQDYHIQKNAMDFTKVLGKLLVTDDNKDR